MTVAVDRGGRWHAPNVIKAANDPPKAHICVNTRVRVADHSLEPEPELAKREVPRQMQEPKKGTQQDPSTCFKARLYTHICAVG